MKKPKIAVLASGRGSVIDKLIAAGIKINLIISNKEYAPVLIKAQEHSIPAKYIKDEATISKTIKKHRIDLILLIGYMRILSAEFVQTWHDRILNVHPSLLPAFAGLKDLEVHKAVLAARATETGCTVHYVDASVDGGKILVQKKCPVDATDTPETLKAKVQLLESAAFIESIRKWSKSHD